MATSTEFQATESFNESRTFGIEIEFKSGRASDEIAYALRVAGVAAYAETYNHATRQTWKIITDASVPGGWELVSPPMAFNEASFAEIKTVSRVLIDLGARVDRQCGLHVHHYARDLTDNQIGKVLAIYAKHEAWIDGMLPASRRGQANGYTKTMNVLGETARTVAAFAACRTRSDIERLVGDRYYKVNPHSLYRHGTLEFRHHSGTVEGAKIVNWIKITRALLQAGATSRSVVMRGEPDAWAFFRAICGKTLTAYIKERTAALAA